MVPDSADIGLTFANSYDARKFTDIAADLGAGGAAVVVERRTPDGAYAFLEWLIPTGVILWFSKHYMEAFLKKSGELHAEALHEGLSKLWNKIFGPKPEITYGFVGAGGPVPPQVFSPVVSVKARRNDGGEAILLFPLDASPEAFNAASRQFIEIMQQHYDRAGDDSLTEAMARLDYLESPGFQALVYRNPETGKLELVDYVESSQAGKLIAYRIGN